MQKLLALFTNLFQTLFNVLKGGDRWFLVIDEVVVAQETIESRNKQLEEKRINSARRDDFNRRYELQCRNSSDHLSFSEIWSTLNPISIFNFLRYGLSDVV